MTQTASSGTVNFPAGFRWSVASSAHQCEGQNSNSDWWDFEMRPGAIKRGERSGQAADHWNRVASDIDLLKSMNLNHARLSVEWARIEPAKGEFDAGAIEHYRNEVQLLKAAGIEPMVTLNHFTLPKWVAAKGGWAAEGTPSAFAQYAEHVFQHLGDLVSDWITINEPMVLIVAGYLSGDFPPAIKDPRSIEAPLCGLIRGHALAYHVLHRRAQSSMRKIRVGLAHHLRVFDPFRRWNPIDRIAAGIVDQAFNWLIPNALRTGKLTLSLPTLLHFKRSIPEAKGTEDFIGLNYYSRDLIRFAPRHVNRFVRVDPPDMWRSDLGWEIYPAGIYRLLKKLHQVYPGKAIMITENGLADAEDRSRERFIREHLLQVHRAIQEGVPVEGYSHWSWGDNFEWAEGFAPRFGLFRVDYSSMQRTPRNSANWYARAAQDNGFVVKSSEI